MQADAPLLDLLGLRCPLPVMRMRAALAEAAAGSRLVIRVNDPLAAVDIPHACREDGHAARLVTRDGTALTFEVRKRI
ncbi:sulfurtransferase TusA family protein [Rhizobiales bacterium Sp-1]|uniref:Sulfurtransferase TusA family protein n=2 Tax=Segnochrobactrum spirostomi TaxID=2608987 RepID=A0A6A7Y067_9HYPH|nr:sulfurtransferase TusA family protein [Segnochrobactrum spirostomi]